MKTFIFALALSVVTLGLISCCSAKSPQNKITIIETSESVTHPALHNGELLVFQVPPTNKNTQTYVHFDPTPGNHPCDETTLPTKDGGPLECKVTANPKVASYYLYLIDSVKDPDHMKASSGKCPPWCPGTLVVAPATKAETTQVKTNQSGPNPAIEVGIYNLTGVPNPASANLGQQVTWFNPGTDSHPWTVDFGKDNICQEKQPMTSGYCTVKPDATPGYHKYTITVDGTTGTTPSQLYVIPPPSASSPQ